MASTWEVNRLPFHKHRQPALPRDLRDDQLLALFAALKRPKYRALFMTLDAAGLRISEAYRLRVEDIDSRRMVNLSRGKTTFPFFCSPLGPEKRRASRESRLEPTTTSPSPSAARISWLVSRLIYN